MNQDVITFAHRGGMAHRPENTLEAFLNARAMGAGAIETDAWLTRDGIVVLHHEGELLIDGIKVPFQALDRSELPAAVPTLGDYYATCGTGMQVAIDVKDPRAAPEIVRIARAAGREALANLWLVGGFNHAVIWRRLDPTIHIAASWTSSDGFPRERLDAMAAVGIEALNVRVTHIHTLLVAACHRKGIRIFAWDVHNERRARRAMRLGVDGMHGNDIGVMLDAVAYQPRQLG